MISYSERHLSSSMNTINNQSFEEMEAPVRIRSTNTTITRHNKFRLDTETWNVRGMSERLTLTWDPDRAFLREGSKRER